ncbi:unnamed protein product [Closterium sp. NIES-53]
MASLRVLAFDHEGRPFQFDTWLDDLQLYLLSDSRDNVLLFDHRTGAAPAPPTTADSATRSQWLTRDAAAHLAIRNHLRLAEFTHFRQHGTAQALHNDVVACYSLPATAALGCLLLPYLFPELSAFATIEDLVSHLRTSDARYRTVAPAESLDRNQPRMYCSWHSENTLSLRGAPPPPLPPPTPLLLRSTYLVLMTSGLLLLVRSAVAVRARVAGVVAVAAGVVVGAAVEVVEAVEVVAAVGVVAGVGALVAAVEAPVGVVVVAAVGVVAVRLELSVEVLEEARGSSSSVGARPRRPSSFESGLLSMGPLGVVVAARMSFARRASRCFFRNSTTLTPLSAPVPVKLADPSGGPVLARSSTVLPCLAYRCPPGRDGHYHDSWGSACVDLHVYTDGPSPGHVHTSSLYILATKPPQVAASAQVFASGQVTPPCSFRLQSHQTLLWHHRLGHPSLPRLRGMHSRLLLSGLPRSLPPLPPSPAPPFLPCVEGRQHTAPHSSSFPPMTTPLQTLHMDEWGPARVSGQGRERYILLDVDDYTHYTRLFCVSEYIYVPVLTQAPGRTQLPEEAR